MEASQHFLDGASTPPFQGGEYPLPAASLFSWEPPSDRIRLIDVRADNRAPALVLHHSIVDGLRLLLPLLESLSTRGIPFLRSGECEQANCIRRLADLEMRFSEAGGNFGIAVVRP